MENITIKRLADQLDLSVSTVSKALRDSHEISAETKTRVLALAADLHYVPNPYASSLRQKKSHTIAVVVPEVADSFLSLVINGIELVAGQKGYHVLMYLTHESFLKEKAILQDFQSGRVDGVLISMSSETADIEHIESLHSKGMPIVFFDRVFEQSRMATVTTNDFESSYQATQHLIEQRCEYIAFLALTRNLQIFNSRLEGYSQALADANLPVRPEFVLNCSNDNQQNYDLIKHRFQSKQRPDAVLASAEKLAITTYQVCAELKLAIPQEIKVVSFSTLETADLLNPSLSTVTQPAFEMGKAAASVLFKALEKKHFHAQHESVRLPSMLIARNSSKT